MWEQLIAQASKISQDVLFVTRDEKADWWRKCQDQRRLLGPRVELVSEMRDRAGVSYFMLRPAQFLKAATELLHVEVSERTIDDASRIVEPSPLAPLTWVDAACEVMSGSDDWWHPREIVAAVAERGLRDISGARTPEDTVRRDLVYRTTDLVEYDGSRFRLMAD